MHKEWTAELVRAALTAAFRKDLSIPIFSPRKGELVHAIDDTGTLEWDMVAATYQSLGREATPRDRERRLMLLTWARCEAGAGETSMREICRRNGWG
jgi:hypothetical protein